MKHLEQSVMWAGMSWMPKWLAVNLTSMVGNNRLVLETNIYKIHCSYRVTSVERFEFCPMVRLCLPGECDVQWYREIRE